MSQQLTLIQRASDHPKRTSIVDGDQHFTYRHLLDDSAKVASALLNGRESLEGERVAIMLSPSFSFVATLWGIWRAGGVAVPLCLSHPIPALRYTLTDTGASTIVAEEQYIEPLKPLIDELHINLIPFHDLDDEEDYEHLPDIRLEAPALILYTSGTTSQPKGVVITHQNIETQVQGLVDAWQWNGNDHILSVLPLHHVHGLINVVTCALWSGAVCEFLPKFEAALVWDRFCKPNVNVFMAVPTIYVRLIKYWESVPEELQQKMSKGAKEFRLMVSGSAALPVSIMRQWNKISGHTLLERYGMTEIGMALSNSYEGERLPGYVGAPLPYTQVRLVNEEGQEVISGLQGEIQVRGDNVFKEYWNKPKATEEAFTEDGWFKTGDVAILENGHYRILGRTSVDIIKSGGFKVSALEIEEVLRQHPNIQECGVVGIPDEEWGEVIAAGLVASDKGHIDSKQLREWAKRHLPVYKVPKIFKFFPKLPRNVLGKLTKPELKEWFR